MVSRSVATHTYYALKLGYCPVVEACPACVRPSATRKERENKAPQIDGNNEWIQVQSDCPQKGKAQ